MKTIDFSYFIERYNAGEMNEAEKLWFRKELAGNYKLREEVELRAKTDMVLSDHATFALRNKLRDIEKRRAEAPPSGNRRKNSAMKYAAVIAVLVILGSIFILSSRNLSNNEIMERFYKPYEGMSASRSLESNANSYYVTAIEYYNIHDFRSAAYFFNKVLEKDPGDMESTMMFGVSSFEEKNYPVAGKSFITVVENNDNLYIEDARWYLALCYIQTNDSEAAVRQLYIIRNSGSVYRKDARKLLRRIK